MLQPPTPQPDEVCSCTCGYEMLIPGDLPEFKEPPFVMRDWGQHHQVGLLVIRVFQVWDGPFVSGGCIGKEDEDLGE